MDLNSILGISFLMVGLVSVSSYSDSFKRLRIPLFFRELTPMRERWGDLAGTVLHFVEYVIIPVGIGVLLLVQGFVYN